MQSNGPGAFFFGGFFLFFAFVWLVAIASFGVGIAGLISVARQPDEAFGPWWDNTKQTWLIGLAVGFVLPFGTLVTGIAWFTGGKRTRGQGYPYFGRPFWAGPPKPMPYGYGPPGGFPPPPPPGGPHA